MSDEIETHPPGYVSPHGLLPWSIRDRFAASAPPVPSLWLSRQTDRDVRFNHTESVSLYAHARLAARWAYEYADSMLKARSGENAQETK